MKCLKFNASAAAISGKSTRPASLNRSARVVGLTGCNLSAPQQVRVYPGTAASALILSHPSTRMVTRLCRAFARAATPIVSTLDIASARKEMKC
jgi:hypothetical protein